MRPVLCGTTLALCWVLAKSAGSHTDSHSDTHNDSNHTVTDASCVQVEGHGDHGSHWFKCEYEFDHFEEVTVITLISITLVVELVKHGPLGLRYEAHCCVLAWTAWGT